MINPMHGCFADPVLWEAKGKVVLKEGPLKCGVKQLTTIRIIDLPELTPEQRIKVAIRCTLTHSQSREYRRWAYGWLKGTDRTKKSINRMYRVIDSARQLCWEDSMEATRAAANLETLGSEYYAAYTVQYSYYANNKLDLVGIIKKVIDETI